jgi:hypothetical protein
VLDSQQDNAEEDVRYRQQHVPEWRLLRGREGPKREAANRQAQESRFRFAANVGFLLLDLPASEQHSEHAGQGGRSSKKQLDNFTLQVRSKSSVIGLNVLSEPPNKSVPAGIFSGERISNIKRNPVRSSISCTGFEGISSSLTPAPYAHCVIIETPRLPIREHQPGPLLSDQARTFAETAAK